VSSARIGGKKTKVYQLEDFYAGTDEIDHKLKKNQKKNIKIEGRKY
jgi:hypothetical protein